MTFEREYRPIDPNPNYRREYSATPDRPIPPKLNIVRPRKDKTDTYEDSWRLRR